MFDAFLQQLNGGVPGSVEDRYALLLKLVDIAETIGGAMLKDDQLTPDNMRIITTLKASLSGNFSAEMQEVTAGWLKAIDQLQQVKQSA